MTLLDLLRDDADDHRPAVIPWEKDEYGHYRRLLSLHPDEEELDGEGGVYVLWHWGQKPEWIHAAATDDLGKALEFARDSESVLTYEPHGGVFVTWAYFKPEFRAGVARYLNDTLEPKLVDILPFDRPDDRVDPVAVQAPH
ncbi:MAG TPA: hypothetical protein VM661_13105 [Candidatus Sulfotelmatobacter sp.]|jgi:hypothetical protein|nr:hypothetical protein [Candidatus Sulfotelmatobacter sp.]